MNRSISVQDIDVSFEEFGSKNNPTILCIHGYPGRPQDFRWLVPELARYRLIILAMPGLDITPLPKMDLYTVASRAKFVTDFMGKVDIEKCVLMTHSMGSVIGTHIAVHCPTLVSQVVFISAVGPQPYRAFRRSRPDWGHFIFTKTPVRFFGKPIVRYLFGMFGFPKGVSTQAMFYVIACGAQLSFLEHKENLSSLKQPVLSIWCHDDPLMEPNSFRLLQEVVPLCEELSFECGGHSPQKKHATKVAHRIIEFIEKPKDKGYY